MRLTWARSVQDVTFNPLLAGIIGAGRSWTAWTISVLSIPRRYTEVIARSAWPSWRWMTSSGTPEQYVSLAFGRAAGQAGIAVSMGSRGDAYDNAVAETFFATLKKELVNRRSRPDRLELQSAAFEYIEAFYNRQRRHSTLGMLSPVAYEHQRLSPLHA
jgi:transposase InsO family protein